MGREIKWKVPGGAEGHSIPDGARVTLVGEHGEVTIGFAGNGSVEYGRHEVTDGEDRAFYGWIPFANELGQEESERADAEMLGGAIRASDYLHAFLGGLDSTSRAMAVIRIVEHLLDDYPDARVEFKRRFTNS